jgi:undecaprenyl-diphosphatase
MSWLEAFLLGLLQGIAEFLPISSSGHLEIGKVFLSVQNADNKLFSVVVHVATVLSTILVFRKDLWVLTREFFRFRWSPTTQYVGMLFLSMTPVGLVGVFAKDHLDELFTGNLLMVGLLLFVTAALLLLTQFYKPKTEKPITPVRAFVIGVAQAIAVLPGISRSGATISTALLMGVSRDQAARFSFLMVIIPILGAGLLEAKDVMENPVEASAIGMDALAIAFVTSLVSGWAACKWMLKLVKSGSLKWFALYCAVVGAAALAFHFA